MPTITAPATVTAGQSFDATVSLAIADGTPAADLPTDISVSSGDDDIQVTGSADAPLSGCMTTPTSTVTCGWSQSAAGQSATIRLRVTTDVTVSGTLTLTVSATTAGGTVVPLGSQNVDVTAAPTTGAAFDIPVEPISGTGGWQLTTWITVNGSDPILVSLDTGTSILVLTPDAIQGAFPEPFVPDDPVIDVDPVYDGTGVNGQLALGTVSVLDGSGGAVVATTPAPVAFVQGVSCLEPGGCPTSGGRVQGVWGIGPELGRPKVSGGITYREYSPVTQFGSPSDQGMTIDYTGDTPRVNVGPVAPAQGETFVGRERTGATKPNGQPEFEDPQLCWTVSALGAVGNGCIVTKIDSGQPGGEITGPQYDPVVTPVTAPPEDGSGKVRVGDVPPGGLVSWSVGPGEEPVGGVVAQERSPDAFAQYIDANGGPEQSQNTGQNFYRLHVVAFDNVDGRVYIARTTGVPESPTLSRLTAAGTGVDVAWTPASTGPQAASWAVTVRDASGAVVARPVVDANSRTVTVAGLSPATAYTVTVAGIGDRGLGRPSAPQSVLTGQAVLPVTGGAPIPWWVAIGLIVAGLGVVVANRIARRAS